MTTTRIFTRADHEEVGVVREDAEVDRALQALPADFRVVVLLVDVGELSYDEAAELLGISRRGLLKKIKRFGI